jgi:hypothetical protein
VRASTGIQAESFLTNPKLLRAIGERRGISEAADFRLNPREDQPQETGWIAWRTKAL